jgi:hypothetical protein
MAQSTQTYEWEAKQRSPDREGGLATTPATISMTRHDDLTPHQYNKSNKGGVDEDPAEE